MGVFRNVERYKSTKSFIAVDNVYIALAENELFASNDIPWRCETEQMVFYQSQIQALLYRYKSRYINTVYICILFLFCLEIF